MLKLNQSGFIILNTLMLLMRIVRSFVWRKFSNVGREEWYNEMKYGQKIKLGDDHVTPRNIQEVQASKLGDAPKHPHLHQQSIRSSFNALYFYCFIYYVLFLESHLFLFSVCVVLFAVINSWILSFLCGRETRSAFSCEYSYSSLIIVWVFLFS